MPELRGVGTFDNVLCETVIMHLDRKQIAPSVRRLLDIVKPSGILYLSWRVTEGADQRDAQGRLYAAFDAAVVLAELKTTTVLLDEEVGQRLIGKEDSPPGGEEAGLEIGNSAGLVTMARNDRAKRMHRDRSQKKTPPGGDAGRGFLSGRISRTSACAAPGPIVQATEV